MTIRTNGKWKKNARNAIRLQAYGTSNHGFFRIVYERYENGKREFVKFVDKHIRVIGFAPGDGWEKRVTTYYHNGATRVIQIYDSRNKEIKVAHWSNKSKNPTKRFEVKLSKDRSIFSQQELRILTILGFKE